MNRIIIMTFVAACFLTAACTTVHEYRYDPYELYTSVPVYSSEDAVGCPFIKLGEVTVKKGFRGASYNISTDETVAVMSNFIVAAEKKYGKISGIIAPKLVWKSESKLQIFYLTGIAIQYVK